MKRLIIMLCISAIVFGCSNTSENKETPKTVINGDTVYVPENSKIFSKLKFQKISSEEHKNELLTSGVVKAIPTNYAQIAAPFAGRITKSFVRLGQKVSSGSPIFAISSPSYFEAGKEYYKAKQEMLLAEKNLKRQQDLLKNHVGVRKDVEEAEVNYEIKKKDYENSIANLQVFHVKPSDLVLGEPLIVRSPISGEIVDNKIVLGQYLKEDAAPVALVAELSKVWIAGHVKEKDICRIHESDEVKVQLSSQEEAILQGKVYHINQMMDEENRTVEVLIECDNKSGNLKPGMYVAVHYFNTQSSAILVPESSVFQTEGNSYVFVKLDKNKFLKKKVVTDGTDHGNIIIKSGLTGNEEIISKGGYYLLEAE